MRSRKAGRNGRGGLYAGHDNNIGKRGYLVMVSIVLSAILDIVWGYRVIVSRISVKCYGVQGTGLSRNSVQGAGYVFSENGRRQC